VLIVGIAIAFLLANLEKIVLRSLRASFPGLDISVADVSLKSLSHLRITGLKVSGPRGENGSSVKIPRVDVRYRLAPFHGLVLKSVDLAGVKAILRPGLRALRPAPPERARKTEAAEKFPAGRRIGRLSLTNSMLDFRSGDLRLTCLLEALADGSSGGILLDDTNVSLRLRNVSLSSPSFRLRNLEPQLSALIAREQSGRRIEIPRGTLSLPGTLRSDFQGAFSFEEPAFTTKLQMDFQPFQLTDVLVHLNDSFPELGCHRIEGKTGARIEFQYTSADNYELFVSGDASLRQGRAILAVPKPLVAEELHADLPFRCSILDGKRSIAVGSDGAGPGGGTIAASRIMYDERELASDLLASFVLDHEFGESSSTPRLRGGASVNDSPDRPKPRNAASHVSSGRFRVLFRSHGGSANADLSGNLRNDLLQLDGDVMAQEIELDEVFDRLGLTTHTVSGRATGKAHLAFAAGPEAPFKLQGEVSFRIPKGTVSFRKPLMIGGLEVNSPFEYSSANGVQHFSIKPTGFHPSGGSVAAERVGYGEKLLEDGTSTSKWTVSGLWANVLSEENAVVLSIKSCRAYDGEITGTISASLEEKALRYRFELQVQDLDLERLIKGLGIKKEQFYMSGLVEGRMTLSGKAGRWEEAKDTYFSSVPPGGIVRIEDVEKLFDSLPGQAGKAALEALKARLGPGEWKSFVEGMKEFRYRSARAEIIYPPRQPRAPGETGPDIEIRVQGTGAGREFDLKISIPVTFAREP